MVNRNYPQAFLHASGVRANQGETGGLTDIEIRRAGLRRLASEFIGAVLLASGGTGVTAFVVHEYDRSPTVVYEQDLQRQEQNQPTIWLEQQLQQQQVEQQQANHS